MNYEIETLKEQIALLEALLKKHKIKLPYIHIKRTKPKKVAPN